MNTTTTLISQTKMKHYKQKLRSGVSVNDLIKQEPELKEFLSGIENSNGNHSIESLMDKLGLKAINVAGGDSFAKWIMSHSKKNPLLSLIMTLVLAACPITISMIEGTFILHPLNMGHG